MSSPVPKPSLPTSTSLPPPPASPHAVAREWLTKLETSLTSTSFDAGKLFLEDSFWKDVLSLTYDHRTFRGTKQIDELVRSRASAVNLSSFKLVEDAPRAPSILQPFPDLRLLQLCFDFQTTLGPGSAVCRLVQDSSESWKAYTVFTCLEGLNGFPEKAGAARPSTWPKIEQERTCLVVGGGHTGLEIAARLGALGVSVTVVEQNPRIGDNWRKRYSSLQLHDSVWYNQTPYMPFPATWPTYSSGSKVGDFLESYSTCLNLDVLTSSKVVSAAWQPNERKWNVSILNEDGNTKNLQVGHLIFATGFGKPKIPAIPNQSDFKGTYLHSASYHTASEYAGKKVAVVGAANSAHDIALDLGNAGVDVTMIQRSSTYIISSKALAAVLAGFYNETLPTHLGDRLSMSFPSEVTKLLHQRVAPALANTIDKDLLNQLASVGFKTNLGPDNSGIMQLFLRRVGGYYVETGASQRIIDGSIKLKSGVEIQSFEESGLRFEDGTRLDADVVIFATGFGDPREIAKEVCGTEVFSKLKPAWGLDEEGEVSSAWRHSGHDGLYFGIGNFALSRFSSSSLALRIKAIEEGILPPP